MIAPRLVRMIETHAEQLSRGLLDKLQRCERLPDLKRVPENELKQRVQEIYRHLSEWLLSRTETEVEQRYTLLGARRAEQGVALSQLLWAILLTKEHLFEFLKVEGLVDRPVEILQEVELFRAVEQFFGRALFYAAVGYERKLSLGSHGRNAA